jgi:hypothetical protein
VSSRRRVRLPRKLERAFRDYLRHGDEATEAVEIINQAIAAQARGGMPCPSTGPGAISSASSRRG